MRDPHRHALVNLGQRWAILSVVGSAFACGGGREPAPAGEARPCADLRAPDSHPGAVCLASVSHRDEWLAISTALPGAGLSRGTRYLLPAGADVAVPPAFLNAGTFERLTSSAGPFAGQAWDAAFVSLVAPRSNPERLLLGSGREVFSGHIGELEVPGLGPTFVYDLADPDSLPCAAQEGLHASILRQFSWRPAYRAAIGGRGAGVPAECDAVPTLRVGTSMVDYEAYTRGHAFGVVRVYDRHTFPAAASAADYGWQNILVLEEAPFDLETVIAGAVTATRQGQLSHLNIRSAARGTPNCFVRDAHIRLRGWDGQLVRLACNGAGLEVRAAQAGEAQDWWAAFRPQPKDLAAPDLQASALPDLLTLPTGTAEERATALRRYGAKGTNLATLYQRIDQRLRLEGFLIPAAAYAAFLEQATVRLQLSQGNIAEGSATAVIPAMLADGGFRRDPRTRRAVLAALQEALLRAPCPAGLVERLADRVASWPRGTSRMWRFRSSSNAEDVIGFGGAGLYASERGCLADDLDGDTVGPSQCDPAASKERPACDALRTVWASLWSPRAFEERDFHGIPHERAVMGVLVNERSRAEQVDIVAFSGDPNIPGDRRYLVSAQVDGLEVVAPEPGTWPETVRLTVEAGHVARIERLQRSSARPTEHPVLTDQQLRELGAAFFGVSERFPLDDPAPPGRDILLDTEWKVRADGRLTIKQIRPYLR